MQTAILLTQCPDAPGIIAKIASWVYQLGGNIIRSDQYSADSDVGLFFMRLEFCFDEADISPDNLETQFSAVANEINATWSMFYKHKKPRVGILVSQHDHCLYDLLYHWRTQELDCDISCVISNHKTCEEIVSRHDLPFHYLPITSATKKAQEADVLSLVTENTDFLVLARYMQILSADFLSQYRKPIINIHHSFLPSFIGANPYQQAYNRGVKLIGATAHYVTEDLDEGPIIEQMTDSVSLYDNAKDLQRKGKHMERLTLLRAVQSHIDHRVIRYGNKTVVFP